MNVAIRTATTDDVDRLEDVRRRASLSNERDRDWLLARPGHLEFDGPYVEQGWTRVAALPDGKVVGFVTAIRGADAFELEDLFVDPNFMRHGIATELVRDTVAVARSHGVGRIDVTANTHALAFYESAGFVVDGVADTEREPAPRLHLDV